MKLKKANKLTVQEACDYAVKKIVKQGNRCINAEKFCVYSDDKNNHCAVGWLLDHKDKELMVSNGSVRAIVRTYPDKIPEMIKNNVEIFNTLQQFHDTPCTMLRKKYLGKLKAMGIDTSKKRYQKWVDMSE